MVLWRFLFFISWAVFRSNYLILDLTCVSRWILLTHLVFVTIETSRILFRLDSFWCRANELWWNMLQIFRIIESRTLNELNPVCSITLLQVRFRCFSVWIQIQYKLRSIRKICNIFMLLFISHVKWFNHGALWRANRYLRSCFVQPSFSFSLWLK